MVRQQKTSSLVLVFLTSCVLCVTAFLIYTHLGPRSSEPDSVSAQALPEPSIRPEVIKKSTEPSPELTARGVMVIDTQSKTVLFEKNAYDALYPASTTKLVTALVTIDSYAMDQVLSVPPLTVEGQKMRLFTGEQISVESLLYGMLVASANDAAEVLAQSYPLGRAEFIQAMNDKARTLGLVSTQFVNPSGLDDDAQYTTAEDLIKIGQAVMKSPKLAQIVATKDATVFSKDASGRHIFSNVNSLLGAIPGVKGIKTGWTEIAGENLLTAVERDNHEIMIALLGSSDRFGETEQLVEWVYRTHEWSY